MFTALVLVGIYLAASNGQPILSSEIDPLSDEMIDRINSMNLTWKVRKQNFVKYQKNDNCYDDDFIFQAGRNFEKSQLDHVKWLLGEKLSRKYSDLPTKTIVQRNGKRRQLSLGLNEQLESLPDSFDARKKWPYCSESIGRVRDQSNCASGWAHAAVETMSDRICIASGGQKNVNISVEDLISCCESCAVDGCKGGDLLEAWVVSIYNFYFFG